MSHRRSLTSLMSRLVWLIHSDRWRHCEGVTCVCRHCTIVELLERQFNESLKFLLQNNGFLLFKSLKLKMIHKTIPKELTSDEISRMGILYINGPKTFKFAHKSFVEFFATQFFVNNIYNAEDTPLDEEAELRIFILKYLMGSDGTEKFVNSFLNSKNLIDSKPFDPQISKVLTTKFKRILIDRLDKLVMINFFKKDSEVLKKLLQINETRNFYDEALSFAGSY